MKTKGVVCALTIVSALAIARSAIAAPITVEGLAGLTVSGVSAVTGGTTINPLGSLGSVAVGAGPEFGFCIGPNADGCVTSGLSGAVDLSDNAITFGFAGSTFATTGSFIITINSAQPIFGAVALASPAISGFTFVLTSATATSLVFTGTPGGGGIYDAVGGRSATFNVATVPEPGSLVLLGSGLFGFSRALLRRRRNP
jgi:hypothetical protein